ncbi:glycosyltransferase [Thermodesulfobacteriota bacterium]
MGLYIQMHSMHGLFRAHHLELGRDEDTGGQLLAVRYLATELVKLPEVDKVDIVVRRIFDPEYPGYSDAVERVVPGVDIIRIECGPQHYLRKVDLWPYLDEYVDNCRIHLNRLAEKPDILHSHYADSGQVCARLAQEFSIPQVHTGHSLGKPKMARMGIEDGKFKQMDARFHFTERFHAEQDVIDRSAALVVSTDEERLFQYNMYDVNMHDPRFRVVTPGVNVNRFHPPDPDNASPRGQAVGKRVSNILAQALKHVDRPMIFTISRLEYRKNLISLLKAYAFDAELQEQANLVIVTGSHGHMGENQQILMNEMETFIDKHQLSTKVCIIKHIDYKIEGGDIFRIVYESGGVYVNPAFHEPFGHALLEAAATGIPVVATDNGGPVEIVRNCKCGTLVDTRDTRAIAEACRKILDDPKLWKAYSNGGIAQTRELYSWESSAKKMLNLYEEILAG